MTKSALKVSISSCVPIVLSLWDIIFTRAILDILMLTKSAVYSWFYNVYRFSVLGFQINMHCRNITFKFRYRHSEVR